jgi:hypothetical protein
MKFVDFMIYNVLCRLSSDLYTIDDSLPFIMNILLANFVGLLGIAIILSYVQVFIIFFVFLMHYEILKFASTLSNISKFLYFGSL